MKIITKREQEKINAEVIEKLRFVAIATLKSVAQGGHLKGYIPNGFIKNAQDRAEQVFYADNIIEYVGSYDTADKNKELYTRNMSQLCAAVIWHLNNPKGTKMGIPNDVYRVWDKKLAYMPKDRVMTESEALEIVRIT